MPVFFSCAVLFRNVCGYQAPRKLSLSLGRSACSQIPVVADLIFQKCEGWATCRGDMDTETAVLLPPPLSKRKRVKSTYGEGLP